MTGSRPLPPGTAPLVMLLRGYQRWISPFLAPRCRFYPTCSSYAVSALTAHGLRSGSWLALRRLLRCQPFAEGGIDLVPAAAGGRCTAGPTSTASTGAPPC